MVITQQGDEEQGNDREMVDLYLQKAVCRKNVGSRNPYVIAKRQLELMHYKADPSFFNPENLQKMMEVAFAPLAFDQMFDPQFGSPMYHGVFFDTLQLAEICQRQYDQSVRLLLLDPARKVGAMPPDYCSGITRSNEPNDKINGKTIQYRNSDADAKANYGLEFNDPLQGCLLDCWFIAALSSLAWVETISTAKIGGRKLVKAPPAIFYPPSTWPAKRTITTNLKFYTDKETGKKAFYTHTPDVFTYYEGWPLFYEKCYASYWQQKRTPPFSQIDTPDYSCLSTGSPFTATMDLTGLQVTDATVKYTVNYFGADINHDNEEQIVEDIRAKACDSAQNLSNGLFLPTWKPVTTYTYLSASSVPAIANQNRGANVAYDNAGIAANHAFSILGVYQHTDGKQYIVLRNPWGAYGERTRFNAYCQGYYLALSKEKLGTAYVNDPAAAGIFALGSYCFLRYFEAFGWAPP